MAKTRKPRSRTRTDKHAVDELTLYIDNDHPLYKHKQAVQVNLVKHACRGNFQREKAAKAFKYVTDEAAKKYRKEFDHTGSGLLGRGPQGGCARPRERVRAGVQHVPHLEGV